jgi:outer membrane immunogenic protein
MGDMKKPLLIGAAFAALIAPALAAEKPVGVYKRPRPMAVAAPIYTWSGFYVGINAGGSIGVSSTTDTGVLASSFVPLRGFPPPVGNNTVFNETFRHASAGAALGGQVGYNWQTGTSLLWGLEADWQASGQRDTATVGGCFSPSTAGFVFTPPFGGSIFGQCMTDERKLTNFGTARARAGYLVNDSLLLYATGGAAWGTVKDSLAYTSSINPSTAAVLGTPAIPIFLPTAPTFSHTKLGWTIGGGVETRLSGPWSLKLEYLYIDLGSTTDAFGIPLNPAYFAVAAPGALGVSSYTVTRTSHFTDNIVRVGLNYNISAEFMSPGRFNTRSVVTSPPPLWSWSGLYVGLNAGGSIGRSSTTDTGVFSSSFIAPFFIAGGPAGNNTLFNESFHHAPAGASLGGQLGYNWQIGTNFLLGLEADWQASWQRDTATVGGCSSPSTAGLFNTLFDYAYFGQCMTDERKLTNFGTARARGGYLVNNALLLYATGGVAWGDVKDSLAYASSIDPTATATLPAVFHVPAVPLFLPSSFAVSHTKVGWTIGGGVETKLSGPWSLKLEYLYIDLGSTTDAFGIPLNPAFFAAAAPGALGVSSYTVTRTSHFTDNIVRVGLNYKFGNYYVPVVTK